MKAARRILIAYLGIGMAYGAWMVVVDDPSVTQAFAGALLWPIPFIQFVVVLVPCIWLGRACL